MSEETKQTTKYDQNTVKQRLANLEEEVFKNKGKDSDERIGAIQTHIRNMKDKIRELNKEVEDVDQRVEQVRELEKIRDEISRERKKLEKERDELESELEDLEGHGEYLVGEFEKFSDILDALVDDYSEATEAMNDAVLRQTKDIARYVRSAYQISSSHTHMLFQKQFPDCELSRELENLMIEAGLMTNEDANRFMQTIHHYVEFCEFAEKYDDGVASPRTDPSLLEAFIVHSEMAEMAEEGDGPLEIVVEIMEEYTPEQEEIIKEMGEKLDVTENQFVAPAGEWNDAMTVEMLVLASDSIEEKRKKAVESYLDRFRNPGEDAYEEMKRFAGVRQFSETHAGQRIAQIQKKYEDGEGSDE